MTDAPELKEHSTTQNQLELAHNKHLALSNRLLVLRY